MESSTIFTLFDELNAEERNKSFLNRQKTNPFTTIIIIIIWKESGKRKRKQSSPIFMIFIFIICIFGYNKPSYPESVAWISSRLYFYFGFFIWCSFNIKCNARTRRCVRWWQTGLCAHWQFRRLRLVFKLNFFLSVKEEFQANPDSESRLNCR